MVGAALKRFGVLLGLLLLSGCVPYDGEQDRIIAEWNNHVDLHNADVLEMNGIMGKYNLGSISTDERVEIVNEYIRFYDIRTNHLSDFYTFIVMNEEELTTAGADTFGWKRDIKDTTTILHNNIERMRVETADLIRYEDELRRLQDQRQATQDQYDDLYELLGLLAALA